MTDIIRGPAGGPKDGLWISSNGACKALASATDIILWTARRRTTGNEMSKDRGLAGLAVMDMPCTCAITMSSSISRLVYLRWSDVGKTINLSHTPYSRTTQEEGF